MATARKTDKKRFRRRLRTNFSLPGPFLVDFGLPAGPQKSPKTGPPAREQVDFFAPEIVFLRFLRSGAFRKGPGPIPEAPGTLPDQILIDFAGSAGILSGFVGFRRDVTGIHRRPPELTLRGSPGVRRSRAAI